MGFFDRFRKGKSQANPAIVQLTPLQKARADAIDWIAHCCRREIEVVVSSAADVQFQFMAIFHELEETHVSLRLPAEASGMALEPFTLLLLTYPSAEKMHAFLASVRGKAESDEHGELLLIDVPKSVHVCEAARSFRIPISDKMEFKTTITLGEDVHSPAARDLSQTGMRVEFPIGRVPEIPLGQEGMAELELEGRSASLLVRFRRRHSYGYGLYFIDSLEETVIQPTEDLREITSILERLWIQERSDEENFL
jgi:hypothetical protein